MVVLEKDTFRQEKEDDYQNKAYYMWKTLEKG